MGQAYPVEAKRVKTGKLNLLQPGQERGTPRVPTPLEMVYWTSIPNQASTHGTHQCNRR